jgi:sugar phosphate isomerase/epimerase
MMKLALCTTTPEVPVAVPVALLAGSFTERLDQAVALGCDGLEFMVLDPDQVDARQIKKEMDRRDLEIAALGTGAQLFTDGISLLARDAETERRAFARFEKLAELTSVWGAPLVTIGSFRGKLAWGDENARQHLVKTLRRCAEAAQDQGVRVALEPLNRYEADFINTGAEGMALVQEIDHPAFGLLLDTFHMNIEEPQMDDAIRTVADRLWHVHLGDSNRLPPGQGHLDFALVVDTLREIGYDGYLSAELLAKPDPGAAAQATMQAMRALVPGS